jgi:D-sedoheptulose 7-phosphate isomerase
VYNSANDVLLGSGSSSPITISGLTNGTTYYVQVFARQVQALGRPGDIFIAYSTSGKSRNVIAAISRAKKLGLTVIGFTGKDPQDMMNCCDFLFQTPSNSTPKIQEGHLVMGHILSGLVEEMLFEKPAG